MNRRTVFYSLLGLGMALFLGLLTANSWLRYSEEFRVQRQAAADAQVVREGLADLAALAAPIRSGSATWLAKGLRNPEAMVCCSRDYPIGTQLVVEANGTALELRVVSWGPEPWTGHDLDLSRGAFRKFKPLHHGIVDVTWQEVRR